MRTAIYLRVSTEDQKTDMQLDQLKRYSEYHGYEIVDIYSDSLSGRTVNRPEFQKMLKWVRYGKYERILIWKLDRFSRSVKDFCNTISVLEEHKVALVSMQDNFDFSTPNGKMIFYVMASVAETESNNISLRTKTGMAYAKKQGRHMGRVAHINEGQVVELYRFKRSMGEVANELGVAKSSISRILNAYRAKKEVELNQPLTLDQLYK